MKIHESHSAPNPRRVRVFLAEKGLQVPYEEVDIGKAVNRGEEFRKKNPLSTVPVLELDDGSYLSESVAICRYLEGFQPEPIFRAHPDRSGRLRLDGGSWLSRGPVGIRCGGRVDHAPPRQHRGVGALHAP